MMRGNEIHRGFARVLVAATLGVACQSAPPASNLVSTSAALSFVTGPAWTARIGTAGTDQINATALDSTGSVLVAGITTSAVDGQASLGGQDVFVTKYSASGTKQWSRQVGSTGVDIGAGVAVGTSDSVFVAGSAKGAVDGQPSLGLQDVLLVKYNASGAKQWTRLFGSASGDFGTAVAAAGGFVYVAGDTQSAMPGSSAAGKLDVVVAKYDESGAQLWAKSFGTSQDDVANGVAVDGAGNVYVAGYTSGVTTGNTSAGAKDLLLAKYDAAGSRLWTRQFGTAADDVGTGLALGGDGSLYVSGITSGSLGGTLQGSTDAFLAKFDTSGTQLWARQLGSVALDEGLGVAADASGVYLTGRSLGQLPGSNSGGVLNLFLAKYDFSGAVQTVREYSGTANAAGVGISYGVAVGGGRIVFGGSVSSGFDGTGSFGGADGVVLSVCDNSGFACLLSGACSMAHGGCTASQGCSTVDGSTVSCGCAGGYTGSTTCSDVNECAVNNGNCGPGGSCTNTVGGRTCGPCPAGYSGTSTTGCFDVDECATNNGGCAASATCTNTPGSLTCACNAGYTGSGTTCSDVDECATANGGCDALTTCTNLPGAYTCGACPAGYSGTGLTGCVDVNECATSHGGCDSLTTCTNSIGSFSCSACPSGYTGTGLSGCVDVDECATNNGGCGYQSCTNTGGSYSCACPPGLADTGLACVVLNPAWTRRFGGSGTDQASGVAIDSVGSVLVSGFSTTAVDGQAFAGAQDAVLAKYSPSGTKLWTREIGTSQIDSAGGIAIGSADAVYVAGTMRGALDGQTNAGGQDAWVSKYDASGTKVWTRLFGTTATDVANAIAVSGGAVYVAGTTGLNVPGSPRGGKNDALMARYDESGASIWVKSFGTVEDDSAQGIAIDGSGNAYVAGTTAAALGGNTAVGGKDIFLAKYDPSGNRLWVKQVGTSADDLGTGVTVGGDGSIYVSGTSAGALGGANAGGSDAVLLKFDAAGTLVWTKQLGSAATDEGLGVASDSSGVYLTGRSLGQLPGGNAAGLLNVVLARYDFAGSLVAVREYSGTSAISGATTGTSIAVSGGRVVVGAFVSGGFDTLGSLGGVDGVVLNTCTDNGFSCPLLGSCATGHGGCSASQVCSTSSANIVLCSCSPGYSGNANCSDVNECGVNNGGCDALTTCANTVGSRTCSACPSGYTGSGATGCVDVNECATNNGGCDVHSTCMNTPGAFTCGACRSGFTGSGATGCSDVDECATNNGGCDALTSCTNTVGSFTCGACPSNLFGTGLTGCSHAEACSTNNGGCDVHATCTPAVDGSAQCACGFGYVGSGTTCSTDPCQASGTTCTLFEQGESVVSQVSAAMERFHQDSGYWPFSDAVWSAAPGYPVGQIDAFSFIGFDTALNQSVPPTVYGDGDPLLACLDVWPVSGPAGLCWNGPYVTSFEAMDAVLDPWGSPLYYTYVRPFDGYGGGVATAPDGFVLVWSVGADGIDQTGCSFGTCGVDYFQLAQGNSSLPFCGTPGSDPNNCSDDIVQYVGTAQ